MPERAPPIVNKPKPYTVSFFIASYAGLYALYALVAYLSPGYDDEIFNIRWVEQLDLGVFRLVEAVDVHPPGQYAVSWLLFTLFGEWELARTVNGLIMASSLVYAIESLRRSLGERSALVALVLLGLNPALLMWCTSLRWYALFVPVLIWLCFPPRSHGWYYWAKCCGGIFVLAYIGYVAFLLAIPIFILYWRNNPLAAAAKTKALVTVGSVFACLYSYQLYIFFTAHLSNGSVHLSSSMLQGITGYLIAQVSNQGVFPLSVAGITSMIGVAGLYFLAIYRKLQVSVLANSYFLPYSLASLLFILSGIAGHFRNFVVLTPLQGLWLATADIELGKGKLYGLFLACVLAGNVAGIVNVISHADTTKNSWNLPIAELSAILEAERAHCSGDLMVATHDPVLAYYFAQKGYAVLSNYAGAEDILQLPDTAPCLAVLKTYVGTLGDGPLGLMYGQLDELQYESVDTQRLGRDSFYAIKQKMDPRFPEFSVNLSIYREVRGLQALSLWLPQTPTIFKVQ